MGDKISAKQTMIDAGIPVVPGSDGPVESVEMGIEAANQIGFPVIVKAAGGGGGKGMKIAYTEAELRAAIPMAKSEAAANFSNDIIYLEKFLQRPRHIEIQILADSFGSVVHLNERDCSLQRKHQKVLEEAPAPHLGDDERQRIGKICCDAIKKIGYRNAGTLEFLYEDGEFYFIEMNTRIQVEHPVTEMICGIDLVRESIRVAAGEAISFKQENVKINGHAIECRICAENPQTFMPSPGKVERFHAPGGIGVRLDSALYAGYTVPPYYDSLAAKLIVHGADRKECLSRLRRALSEIVIDGIDTTVALHQMMVDNPDIISGNYDIHWLEKFVAGSD
jgi:acetyl-CoA carboxylase biotin carboxylase subunit